MFEVLARDHPGRSAARRHKELSRRWRRRTFGHWGPITFWVTLVVIVGTVAVLHPGGRLVSMGTLVAGMLLMSMRAIPDALLPGHIFNWQLGAWGEQNTATELKRLPRSTWAVRHDLRWGENGNHDHLVAGPAVYVLNTKNLKDSRVTIEGTSIRVQRLDDESNSYLADRWLPSAAAEARSLERELERALDFPVAVYPVVVVWAEMGAEPRWVEDCAWVVHGDRVVDWIAKRPIDILKPEKRARLMAHVRSMPRAGTAR